MSGPIRLAVVGDALLDRDVEGEVSRLAPDAPVPVVEQHDVVDRPGGAALAAALAARGGHAVRLVAATAADAAGADLRAALAAAGVELADLGLDGPTPEKIRVRAQGRALMRVDRGGAGGAVGSITAPARAAIAWADAILVADYGRGVAAEPSVRAALQVAVAARTPVVWDPHPRGAQPVGGVSLATPNAAEARALSGRTARAPSPSAWPDHAVGAAIAAAEALRARWGARAVCVTRGADGAVLAGPGDGPPLVIGAGPVPVGDPCGAGDRFAARAAEALGAGATCAEAVIAATAAASAFVAAGGAAAFGAEQTPASRRDGAVAIATGTAGDRVRAQGGTIVATGGCFDLLHPGHVRTLQAARALGDHLVVCLNSDASVRRLKGPGRPVVGQDDRAAVLRALGCVDDVVVFDADTPVEVLQHLRPDVWAKGGDYAGAELPEAAALATWGGRAVVLPFVVGRSTTRILEGAALRAV